MRPGKCNFIYSTILTLAIGAFVGTGCKKSDDGISNNNVVRTPYVVYFSDRLGNIYNTNDGKAFRFVLQGDGVAARALTVSGTNILMSKFNIKLFPNATVFVSADNGLNFNPTSYSGTASANRQSMLLNVPGHKRIYLASAKGKGVEYSEDNGVNWQEDKAFSDPNITTTTIESFTQLKDGKLYAFDNSGPRLFERGKLTDQWAEKTMSGLPNGGRYFLSHFNNVLIAASTNGVGVYYSNDNGGTWNMYGGVPAGQKVYSAAGPLNQAVLVGTDSAGIYRLEGSTFVPSNNGLTLNTTVYDIVGKEEVFKNEVIRQYVYIATSTGLYRSEDLGKNWTAIRPGDMRLVY